MTESALTTLGFRAGIWRGRLVAKNAPAIEVCHAGDVLEGVEVFTESKDAWLISVPIPADRLGEGINTFLLIDQSTGADIGSFGIAIAECAADDLGAEVHLLRAELDLLKKAFRRHVDAG